MKSAKSNLIIQFIVILYTITILAQHTKMQYTIEQLKIKPKQEIIQIALDILKKKQPSLIIDRSIADISISLSDLTILSVLVLYF